MGDPSEVIDLTNSFSLGDLPVALVQAVIEDSLQNSLPRSSRRTRNSRRRTTNAQCPIEVVETPVENLTPNVRRKTGRRQKSRAATKNVPTDDEVVRDRSPLDKGIGTCAICLERFKLQPLASTRCGHVFCEKCLKRCVHIDPKCPTCRKSLKGKNAYHPIFL